MEKFKFARWRNWSFFYKMLIIYIPLIVLPSVVGLSILINSYNQASVKYINQYLKNNLELTADKIDTEVSDYNNITLKLITSPEISHLLSVKSDNQFEQMANQQKLESYVGPIIGSNTSNIISCVFVTKYGRYIIGDDNVNLYFNNEENFINKINEGKGSAVWLNPKYFFIDNKKVKAFRVGRLLRDQAFNQIGVVYLIISENWINNIIENQISPKVHLEVLDSNGLPILGAVSPASPKKEGEIETKTKLNNWKIVASYKFSELYSTVDRMSNITKYLILLCAIIGLLATYMLVTDLIVPIRKLRINMNRGIMGRKPEEMSKFKGAREICELNDLFISVMYEVYNLIEKEKISEKQKRQIEIKLLQKQISPHFLYNTLNSIRWIAMIKQQKQIKEMIDALTSLLTYSIRDTDELVLLEEELNMLQDYVKIQRVRYQDFEFSVHKETEIGGMKILKFILQPLIENALLHGLSNYEGLGKIEVFVNKKCNMLYIRVSDNGIGISSERLLLIQKILDRKLNEKDKHIGLRSIQERIKESYGESYGLHITSKMHKGTSMELRLPIITNKREGDL